MQGKIADPSDDVRHVFFRVTVYEKVPLETSEPFAHRPLARSVQSATVSATLSRSKRPTPCSGFSHTKTKSLPSIGQATVLSISQRSAGILPAELGRTSKPVVMTKDKDKRRRSSRRQSILSIASSYFGPTALGSDISLDRQISPALQTSHVFFDSPSRSPYSLSQKHMPDDPNSTSSLPFTLNLSQEPDVLSLSSPSHPSPPAPSLDDSVQSTPACSGEITDQHSGGTTPATNTTAADTTTTATSRQPSKLTSISSFLPSFSERRRTSVANFLRDARDLPSRVFRRSSKSPSPPQLRSTCPITEKDTMPPKKRRPTKVEKAALKRQKSADKYIQKKTKKRLRQYRREMKRRMSETEEAKEARKKMGKTEKLLKVMDDAKEKFWEWLDKREAQKRRKQTRAYTTMREERRKSVLLVPVERDYEVLSRRGSKYDESFGESSVERC